MTVQPLATAGRGNSMLATQRREAILAELRGRGGVRIAHLADRLAVSPATVRRDLALLEGTEGAIRVHGGALRAQPIEPPAPDATPATTASDQREAIATAAARMVRPQMTIGLSDGPLVHALARRLTELDGLTVVTNSLQVAEILGAAPAMPGCRPATVVLTGGFRDASDALVGPVATGMLRSVRMTMSFLDCDGLDADAGATAGSLNAAEVRSGLVRSSSQVVALAGQPACGRTALSTFAVLDEISTVVTAARSGKLTEAQHAVLRKAAAHVVAET